MSVVLWDLKDKMREQVEAMTVSGGYNFDWGTVNVIDQAQQRYPSADIYLPENIGAFDDFTNATVGSYHYSGEMRVVVRVQNERHKDGDKYTGEPKHDIERQWALALEDLLRLWGGSALGELCDIVAGNVGLGEVTFFYEDAAGDIRIPGRFEMAMPFEFSVLRSNPSQVS